jgi:hypothetical protein
MKPLTDAEIHAYLKTRKWEGCSGAYAIQLPDDPYLTVEEGSVSNVIGRQWSRWRRPSGGWQQSHPTEGHPMSDRLAELLAKAQNSLLSEAETEELARFLNAPILDPLTNPPPGFVSKYSFSPSDLTARLQVIDWFSHCGEPVHLDLTMEVKRLAGWAEVMESCSGVSWENVQLEAQNQLSIWLHQNARERYRTWNEVVIKHKAAVIEPLSREKWVPFQQANGLEVRFVYCVEWDVLGALMENSFLDTGHQCFFFLELLTVYEAGHFPCGWRGNWPDGKLLVY